MKSPLQTWANALQAIAQSGIAITNYSIMTAQLESKLKTVVGEMIASDFDKDIEPIPGLLENISGYAISRTTVRGAVFRDDAILLVRAPSLGRESWALPGGSAEINESPSQTVIREIWEETGYQTEVMKLVAVSSSGTLPSGIGANLFFQCRITGGQATTSDETDEVAFFKEQEVSTLETWGPTGEQIVRLYEHRRKPSLPTEFGVPPWI